MADKKDVPAKRDGGKLVIPDDVRADLLKSQIDQIDPESSRLPRVSIMGAGAGLFEFSEDGETVKEFNGVILFSHAMNVLWDSAYEDDKDDDGPACVADDGKVGHPRAGFEHEALGREADGDEEITCQTCDYNQWGSVGLLPHRDDGKSKACANKRRIYIMLDNREFPVELTLPPTSLVAFNEYIATLTNRGDVMQGVVTRFYQTTKESGKLKWSVAQFEAVRELTQDEFDRVLAKRKRYKTAMDPSFVPEPQPVSQDPDDDLPF